MDFTTAGCFRSEGNFNIIFAAHFTAAKRAYDAAKWHSCAKWWFRSCVTPFEMASRLQSGGFQGVEISQPFRSCEMGVLGCEMALVCQGVSSQRKVIFVVTPEGCKIFRSERRFSQTTLGCEISQTMLSRCF